MRKTPAREPISSEVHAAEMHPATHASDMHAAAAHAAEMHAATHAATVHPAATAAKSTPAGQCRGRKRDRRTERTSYVAINELADHPSSSVFGPPKRSNRRANSSVRNK
jgi:hypothetical protein